jgi:ABC-type Na+ efflux pump permease subunit
MRMTMLLARKDLRTLVRSRALLIALMLYPVLLAAVLGAVLLTANRGATIALVNQDTTGSSLTIGDRAFGIAQYRARAKASGVRIMDTDMNAARRALDDGQVQGILVIPQGFTAKLSTQLAPSTVEFYTGSSALSDMVSQRMRGVIYKINLEISNALIDENAKYLQRLISGGEVRVLGETYDLYGLAPLEQDLRAARETVDDEAAREAIDNAIDFADDAGAALSLADNALEATSAPIRLERVITRGKSPALTARAMSFALAITLALICVPLIGASLAAERDEHVLPRLLRSGVSRMQVTASKLVLGSALATIFSLGLFAVFAVLAPQAWSRLPLLVVCVVVAAAAYSAVGALIATLAADARSATLVSLLVVLPMIPVALVSGTGWLQAISSLLPVSPSMELFNAALFEANPWAELARGCAHLMLMTAVLAAGTVRLLRRLT